MDEQSRPAGPHSARGDGDSGAGAAREQGSAVPPAEQTGKLRPAYLDPSGSEATRELRDTARRRREAEEKLQQHLMEAKDHVPNEFHEHGGHGPSGHGHSVQGDPEHGHSGQEKSRAGLDESRHPGDGEPEANGPDGERRA
jgi:hypothetical protein